MFLNEFNLNYFVTKCKMGIGDWGLGIGDWGLGPIPNTQSPIPNPQSPIKFMKKKNNFNNNLLKINYKFKTLIKKWKNQITNYFFI